MTMVGTFFSKNQGARCGEGEKTKIKAKGTEKKNLRGINPRAPKRELAPFARDGYHEERETEMRGERISKGEKKDVRKPKQRQGRKTEEDEGFDRLAEGGDQGNDDKKKSPRKESYEELKSSKTSCRRRVPDEKKRFWPMKGKK